MNVPGWDIEYSTPKTFSLMVLPDDAIPPTVTDRDQDGSFGKWLRGHIAERKGIEPEKVKFVRMRMVA